MIREEGAQNLPRKFSYSPRPRLFDLILQQLPSEITTLLLKLNLELSFPNRSLITD
jgi:hypothetical protein